MRASGNPSRRPLSLSFEQHAGQVSLACSFPPELRAIVESQLFAAYPEAVLEELEEAPTPEERQSWSVELHLHRDLFPIKRYPQFEERLLTFTERMEQTPNDPFLPLLAADTLSVAQQAQPKEVARTGVLFSFSSAGISTASKPSGTIIFSITP